MARRSIEETFQAIAPSRRRGIPNPAPISVGVSSENGDIATSMSQAAQEISQLRDAYQQQADLIQSNTQAVQNNTSAQGSHSAASTIGSAASGLLGGGLGLLSPIISGIASLFGGGSSAPPTLPLYTPPPPVDIGGILHAPATTTGTANGSSTAAGQTAPPNPAPSTQQVTVNVTAMDSQSFMDRSTDIANAVREAMLNNHPINSVVANL